MHFLRNFYIICPRKKSNFENLKWRLGAVGITTGTSKSTNVLAV
jgi:hypothetical protein